MIISISLEEKNKGLCYMLRVRYENKVLSETMLHQKKFQMPSGGSQAWQVLRTSKIWPTWPTPL